jgi:uncharacterized protein YbjT (DUF2867 family)
MRVLMVGATGRHAHWVLRELTQRGVEVRALVRNEQRAQVARRNGAAETVIADLTQPASLNDAVAGMEGVFHIGPAHAAGEAEMALAMVDAARAAGARKFVYSAVIHPSISAMTNHAAAKLPVERRCTVLSWISPCCSRPGSCRISSGPGMTSSNTTGWRSHIR